MTVKSLAKTRGKPKVHYVNAADIPQKEDPEEGPEAVTQ